MCIEELFDIYQSMSGRLTKVQLEKVLNYKPSIRECSSARDYLAFNNLIKLAANPITIAKLFGVLDPKEVIKYEKNESALWIKVEAIIIETAMLLNKENKLTLED